MEDPGGQDIFEHDVWHFPFGNEEMREFKVEELFASDALLLGRVTYEGLLPYGQEGRMKMDWLIA